MAPFGPMTAPAPPEPSFDGRPALRGAMRAPISLGAIGFVAAAAGTGFLTATPWLWLTLAGAAAFASFWAPPGMVMPGRSSKPAPTRISHWLKSRSSKRDAFTETLVPPVSSSDIPSVNGVTP